MRLITRNRVSTAVSLLIITALGLAFIVSVKGAVHAVNLPIRHTLNTSTPVDWPMFGFDLQQDHFNSVESTLSTSNVSNLTQAWSASTQTGLNPEPVVANGIVYVTAASTTTSTIYAFNATTGAKVGEYQLPGSPNPPYSFGTNNVAVDSGTVYAAAGYKFYNHGVLNEGGILYAFSANLGTPLWSITLPYAFTTPKVTNGIIYIGTIDHGFYAYKVSDQSLAWSKPTSTVTTSPAISSGVIYIGSSATKNGSTVNSVIALNTAQNGTYNWTSTPLDSTVNSVAVGSDGNIYAGTQAGSLYAFSNGGAGCKNGGTCTPLWSYTNPGGNGYSGVAVANGVVYAGSDSTSATNAVSAFNISACTSSPSTCAPAWTSSKGGSSSNLTVANGVVYAGLSDNTPSYTLVAFDASGCSQPPCSPTWSTPGTSAFGTGIAVVNGTIYAGSTTDGILRAYTLPVSGGIAISLSVTSGPPTTNLKVSGTGFGPNETITISFDKPQTQVTAQTDSTGAFPATAFTIPAAAQPGPHTITATGTTSDSAQATFTVRTNWSLFGFDSSHSHLNPYENTLNTTNIQVSGNLKLAWSALASNYITTSPVVVDGIVYFGSADHRFYAINTNTSKRTKTSYNTGNPIYSSSAVDNGTVFITTYTNKLYALDAASINKVEWTGAIGNTKIGYSNQSSPVVANGVVYVGGSDHKLYAFSESSNPSNCNTQNGQLVCQPLWTGPTGNVINSSPAVANGVVYVGSSDGNLYAFNANGCGGGAGQPCQPLWSAATGGAIFSSPAVANGVVYVGSTDSILYAFNAAGCGSATCPPLWTATTEGEIFSSPAVANGMVYIGSYDHNLYAFKASGCGHSTCSPLWKAPTGNIIQSSPSVANGIVFVGSNDDSLYAFDATAGTLLWSYATKGAIKSSAIIANGMVYVGSYDSRFYVFKLLHSNATANRHK
jgi:outer membrane protein assembly factor BamB